MKIEIIEGDHVYADVVLTLEEAELEKLKEALGFSPFSTGVALIEVVRGELHVNFEAWYDQVWPSQIEEN